MPCAATGEARRFAARIAYKSRAHHPDGRRGAERSAVLVVRYRPPNCPLAKGRFEMERQSTKLRALLRAKTFLHMPSVYNVIGGRLVESLGFEAAYIGGYVTGASTAITEPLLTMNEQ